MKAVTFHISDRIALETQNGLAYLNEWENSEEKTYYYGPTKVGISFKD